MLRAGQEKCIVECVGSFMNAFSGTVLFIFLFVCPFSRRWKEFKDARRRALDGSPRRTLSDASAKTNVPERDALFLWLP